MDNFHDGAKRLQDINSTIRRCRRGDPLAWEALVKFYQGRVFAVSYYYMKNRDDAADMAQDAFVKVYAGIASFKGDQEAFLPWLLSVTRNCCIDRLRKNHKRSQHETELDVETAIPDQVANTETGPETNISRHQERQMLYQALEKISSVNRDILLLKDIQGLKNEDVAAILSLPVGTIKSRSHRARATLGRLLADMKTH